MSEVDNVEDLETEDYYLRFSSSGNRYEQGLTAHQGLKGKKKKQKDPRGVVDFAKARIEEHGKTTKRRQERHDDRKDEWDLDQDAIVNASLQNRSEKMQSREKAKKKATKKGHFFSPEIREKARDQKMAGVAGQL